MRRNISEEEKVKNNFYFFLFIVVFLFILLYCYVQIKFEKMGYKALIYLYLFEICKYKLIGYNYTN